MIRKFESLDWIQGQLRCIKKLLNFRMIKKSWGFIFQNSVKSINPFFCVYSIASCKMVRFPFALCTVRYNRFLCLLTMSYFTKYCPKITVVYCCILHIQLLVIWNCWTKILINGILEKKLLNNIFFKFKFFAVLECSLFMNGPSNLHASISTKQIDILKSFHLHCKGRIPNSTIFHSL